MLFKKGNSISLFFLSSLSWEEKISFPSPKGHVIHLQQCLNTQLLNNLCHFRKKECEKFSCLQKCLPSRTDKLFGQLEKATQTASLWQQFSFLYQNIGVVSLFFVPETRDGVAKQSFSFCERNHASLDVSILFSFSTVPFFSFEEDKPLFVCSFTSLHQLLPEVEQNSKVTFTDKRCCSLQTK